MDQILYEPFAEALYVYKPYTQVLTRIYKSHQDQMILKGAKFIQIDSELAKMCWVEYQQSIRCGILPKLNENKIVFKVDRFSESLVYGMAIDETTHILHFMVHTITGTTLYSYGLETEELTKENDFSKIEVSLEKLQCYFEKCFWIALDYLMVYDVKGKGLSKLKMLPNTKDFVINWKTSKTKDVFPSPPEDLSLSSQNILTWSTESNRISNTTYNLLIETNGSVFTFSHLSDNFLDISDIVSDLKPYSALHIDVLPETPWATAKTKLSMTIHLPMGKPSEPTNPRVFWELPR